MSQADLGVRLGLIQTRVARIEGRPLSVSVEQLFQVLSALGLLMTLEPLPSAVGADALADVTSPPIAPVDGDW